MMEWLFKYPASTWRSGTVGFDSDWPPVFLVVAILTAFIVGLISLRAQPLSLGRKMLVYTIQGFVAVVAVGLLWQPVLKVEVAEQGENTVAWVVDTSQSMRTQDVPLNRSSTANQQSRLAAAQGLVGTLAVDNNPEFEPTLYALGDSLQPITSVGTLQEQEPSATTGIGEGLDELLGTVAQSALAAVVLVSDGSDNGSTIDAQWWQRLSASGVPVHTVGVGRLQHPSDIQLSDVVLPEQAGPDVQVNARLTIEHAVPGTARIRVYSGRDLIATEDIELPADVDESVHEIAFPTGDSGIRQLRFDVVSDDELVDPDLLNNVQPRVLSVAHSPKRILYVEGEPRWEYKFLRRALDNHPIVEVVSLLRTSPNKFYRQGVRDASELADGFPSTREDLFSYDAVIIGSLEAAELSIEQQLALRDFVSVRGGSLLMLAGRHGLSDGGWGRSVTAAALPVTLDARLNASTYTRDRAKAVPTVSGLRTDWLSLEEGSGSTALGWEGLPDVADRQSLGPVKPGAVVLLELIDSDSADSLAEPLLVQQRYGKGQSYVLATSGTWRWQMGLDSSDQRHEMFWAQLASALVDGVLQRISVTSDKHVYRDSDSATLSLNAYAADFTPLRESSLPVQLTLPDGSVSSVEFTADTRQPGVYNAAVDTPQDGPYTINAMTPLGGESPQSSLVSSERWWVRESGTAESFDNTRQQEFLQRIADASGGSYLAFEDADSLLDVLSQKNVALKREVSLPLWNMPFFFLCLFLAKLLEWVLRLRWNRL